MDDEERYGWEKSSEVGYGVSDVGSQVVNRNREEANMVHRGVTTSTEWRDVLRPRGKEIGEGEVVQTLLSTGSTLKFSEKHLRICLSCERACHEEESCDGDSLQKVNKEFPERKVLKDPNLKECDCVSCIFRRTVPPVVDCGDMGMIWLELVGNIFFALQFAATVFYLAFSVAPLINVFVTRSFDFLLLVYWLLIILPSVFTSLCLCFGGRFSRRIGSQTKHLVVEKEDILQGLFSIFDNADDGGGITGHMTRIDKKSKDFSSYASPEGISKTGEITAERLTTKTRKTRVLTSLFFHFSWVVFFGVHFLAMISVVISLILNTLLASPGVWKVIYSVCLIIFIIIQSLLLFGKLLTVWLLVRERPRMRVGKTMTKFDEFTDYVQRIRNSNELFVKYTVEEFGEVYQSTSSEMVGFSTTEYTNDQGDRKQVDKTYYGDVTKNFQDAKQTEYKEGYRNCVNVGISQTQLEKFSESIKNFDVLTVKCEADHVFELNGDDLLQYVQGKREIMSSNKLKQRDLPQRELRKNKEKKRVINTRQDLPYDVSKTFSLATPEKAKELMKWYSKSFINCLLTMIGLDVFIDTAWLSKFDYHYATVRQVKILRV